MLIDNVECLIRRYYYVKNHREDSVICDSFGICYKSFNWIRMTSTLSSLPATTVLTRKPTTKTRGTLISKLPTSSTGSTSSDNIIPVKWSSNTIKAGGSNERKNITILTSEGTDGPLNWNAFRCSWQLQPLRLSAVVMVMIAIVMMATAAMAQQATDVSELGGDSDFNKVQLHWRYGRMGAGFGGFKITHCEDQAWGPHRCRNTVLSPNELTKSPLPNGLVEYSGQISHLRMATNYSIEVTPINAPGNSVTHDQSPVAEVDAGEGAGDTSSSTGTGAATDISSRTSQARGRAIPDGRPSAQVFLQTKGFSAKAVSCLTNSTQVEVNTGPYFGGKISVEGSLEQDCATHGDAKSSTTKYKLNINHSLCGSKLLNDSVRTYILVQENLPILTHSTRRFMVVCHYVPEAFTVSAGVSLPEESKPPVLVPVDQFVNEVDPSELFDATNDLFSRQSAGSRRTGKALRLEQDSKQAESPRMWTQLVLMVILVVGAVVGLSCAFWHFGRHAGFTARRGAEGLPSVGDELESVESSIPSDAEGGDPVVSEQQEEDQPELLQQEHRTVQQEQQAPIPTSALSTEVKPAAQPLTPPRSLSTKVLSEFNDNQKSMFSHDGSLDVGSGSRSQDAIGAGSVYVQDLLGDSRALICDDTSTAAPTCNTSSSSSIIDNDVTSNSSSNLENNKSNTSVDSKNTTHCVSSNTGPVMFNDGVYVNTSPAAPWESFDDAVSASDQIL